MSADEGAIRGNFKAVSTLAIIIILSLALVFATILVPSLPSLRHVDLPIALLGSAYFLLIGLGFMFVEMGTHSADFYVSRSSHLWPRYRALRHYRINRLRQSPFVAHIPVDRETIAHVGRLN